MKIIVSRYWRLEFWSFNLIELVIFGLTILFSYDDIYFALFLSGCSFVLLSICQISCLICQQRFLSYVIYEDGVFTSFRIWRKKLCTITENACIYYTKINCRVSMKYRGDYVFISNEPFEYHEVPELRIFPWQPKPIQHTYSMKKIIMLPYEENAPYLSKLSEWTRIYPKSNI